MVAAARWRLRWMPGNAEKSVEQLSAFAQANQDPASAARRWLIAALAASGKVAEANRQLQEARGGNAAEWLAIARQLVETSRPAAAEAQASLAELRLGALHRIDADSPELTATERLFVRREQAQGLLDAGQRAEGLAAWEKLAKSRPEDGALQQQFAEALEGSSDPATAEKALAQWRLVFARSAGRSELWYRANLGIATSLHRLGRKGEARELIELLIARPPGLEKTARKKEFLELLRRSSE